MLFVSFTTHARKEVDLCGYIENNTSSDYFKMSPDVATEKQLFLHFLTFPSAQVLVVESQLIISQFVYEDNSNTNKSQN